MVKFFHVVFAALMLTPLLVRERSNPRRRAPAGEKGWRSVDYDCDNKVYVEPATGSQAKFRRVHPGESWFEVDFNWSAKRFRFLADLAQGRKGSLTFRLVSSSYFEPKRSFWVSFSDLPDIVEALRPFVAAWSLRAWQGEIVAFQDDRGDKGRTLEEALGAPSQEALKELVSKPKQARR